MKKLGIQPEVFRRPAKLKFFLLMKCSVIILLFACLEVSANGFSQNKITVNLPSVEMKRALSVIERKSDFRFLYNQALLSKLGKVSLVAQDEDVPSVLNRLFQNTPVSYQLLANNLVVLKNRDKIVVETRVTGKVTDASGAPIQGASVTVKGTTSGTTTDAAGNYIITVPDDATLVFSFIGYQEQDLPVSGRTVLNVTMAESNGKSMDEVVVIGYGTANKRDLTGSIAKVSGKDVAEKPNANPVASLQGKVAGVSVVNNGVPGSQPDVRIRGTISINQVHPLYVVDGIFQDNIDYINPNDIESMEILKDPSSLAIFGVKGAAGVITVTTKRAKLGQVLVNFNATAGTKKLVDKIQLASGDQFRSILTAEGNNENADNSSDVLIKNFVENDISKWTGNTDWVNALTRKALFNTDNISVNASSEKNKFYMGVGYTYDEGIVKHTQYERMNINIGDEFKVSKVLKLGFAVNGTREKLPIDGNQYLNSARQIFPIVSDQTKSYFVRNPYGSVLDSSDFNLYSGLPVLQNSLANPLLELENRWDKQPDIQYRTVGNVFAEISFLKNFNFRATLYADVANENKTVYTPIYDAYDPGAIDQTYPVYRASTVTEVATDLYDRKRFQGDYILNYKKSFGDHSVTATAGWTHFYQGEFQNHVEIKQKSGDDPIPNDKRFWYVSSGFGDATTRKSSSNQFEAATLSALARILYNYKGKYFVNGSFRRDGSSGINTGRKQWQNFWAIGAAWELTKENFMAEQSFFNYLKVKGSTGVLGNANLGSRPYAFYSTISSTSSAVFGTNIAPAYAADFTPDPNLRWEEVHSQEVGVEGTALSNRLSFEVDYYNKDTKNVLELYTPSGGLQREDNNGTINNHGFEFTAGWNQRVTRDVNLSINGNLTTFNNKVVTIGYPIIGSPNYTRQGFPIGSFYGYEAIGIYQNAAEIDKSPFSTVNGGGAKPGDLKYADLDGNDTINDVDQKIIGNPTPKFAYGISAAATYKGFDLGVDFNGVSGNQIFRIWGTSEQKNSVYNYPAYYANAWSGEGTSNTIPIVNAKHLINRAASTYGIESGSYIRVRNIALGYSFASATLSRAHIKTLRVFVNVQNLKTWKHNIGYSPEFGGALADQAITGDEKTKSPSSTSFGIDYGDSAGALPRIWTGGINVTF